MYTSSIPADYLANYWEKSGVSEMEESQWCYMQRPSRSTQRKAGGDTGKKKSYRTYTKPLPEKTFFFYNLKVIIKKPIKL